MKTIIYILILLIVGNNGFAINSCVTINPLYGIVSYITKGIDIPALILDKKNVDLHSYALTPSDALKIKKCDVIFMIHNDFENFSKKLNKLKQKHTKIIRVSEARDLNLLETRENNVFEEDLAQDHEHALYDYHIWLDVNNAKYIAIMIANELSALEIKNSKIYQENLNDFIKKLQQLDQELTEELSTINTKPYVVFHDAYQYFENKYNLNSVGAIVLNQSHNINANSLIEIKELIVENHIKCIFSEPQFPAKIIDKIAKNSKVNYGVLNAEWADSNLPQDIYFVLMRNLATSLKNCLK